MLKQSILAAFVVLVGVALTPLPAAARVPQGFVGMTVGLPIFPDTTGNADLSSQFDLMASSGVETARVSVDWASMQPYRSWSDVQSADKAQFGADGVDRVPTRFGQLDALVGQAAQRGLSVLPTVVGAPSWDGRLYPGGVLAIPSSNGPYGNFVKALVLRYGPHGSFWQGRPRKAPIRMWEIWNEPNIIGYWPLQPFQKSYVALLRVAYAAIKKADPRATVVLAGMPNYSWGYLTRIYKVPGARRVFDVVAVHPYTRHPQGVITIISKVRQVMNSYGDARKPIVADEMGWPSSQGQTSSLYGFETTEAGQARNIAAVLPMLGRERKRLGLLGFDYYTWVGVEQPSTWEFYFSGLLRFSSGRFIVKPGLSAFSRAALALESCRKKAPGSTRCVKPA